MFAISTLAAFLTAGVIIVLLPGPGQALVLARSVTGGFRAGLAATLGLNTGTLVHAVAAGFGLSAVLAASATAFTVVKLAGAIYLVVLGVLAWRSGAVETPRRRPGGYLSAVLIGVLNPKVALFFLAFLPQFVRPERGAVLAQFLVLGLILAVLGVLWDCVLSLAAHTVAPRILASHRLARWRGRITGTVFVALGIRLAFTEQR